MNTKELSTKPTQRRHHRAIGISLFVHAVGAVVLLGWYLPARPPVDTNSPAAWSATPEAGSGDTGKGDAGHTAATPPLPPPTPEIPAEQIESSIDLQLQQIEKLPTERKLSELEKNLRRLEQVATPASTDQVSSTIASTLGFDSDVYQPKPQNEIPGGELDVSTAQLQDVTRQRDASGQWVYESVLVDAAGRTMRVPMSVDEGETAYATFEQMKKFPMAAGIYRSVVMPMLQKMVAAQDLAQQAAIEVSRQHAE